MEKSIISDLFRKSKKQKGNLYILKREYSVFRNVKDEHTHTDKEGKKYIKKEYLHLGENCVEWKYGKTKDLKKRMSMYSDTYSLLKSYKVNHLSFREDLIRWDRYIEDDRRGLDGRTEHVSFDCSDIVDLYANCEIKLDDDRIRLFENGIEFCSMSSRYIIDSLHF